MTDEADWRPPSPQDSIEALAEWLMHESPAPEDWQAVREIREFVEKRERQALERAAKLANRVSRQGVIGADLAAAIRGLMKEGE